MEKKAILLITSILICVILLSGCNALVGGIDIEENIIGQWFAYQDGEAYGFTFYSDGRTCKHSAVGGYNMGEYLIVGDKLEFHHPEEEYISAFQNYYDIEMPDEDTLILTARGSGRFTFDGTLEFTRLN